jgi:hypothetical protein
MRYSAMLTNIGLELHYVTVLLYYKHGAFKNKEKTLHQWAVLEQV